MRPNYRTRVAMARGEAAQMQPLIAPDDLAVFATSAGNHHRQQFPHTGCAGDGRPDAFEPIDMPAGEPNFLFDTKAIGRTIAAKVPDMRATRFGQAKSWQAAAAWRDMRLSDVQPGGTA